MSAIGKGPFSVTEPFSRRHEHLQGLHWKCFGCGDTNQNGLRLNVRLKGDRTVCEFAPTADLQSVPGICHSGVVAAVLDEVMSQLVYAQLEFAVTRKVEITYRRPVRVGHVYTFSAEFVTSNRRVIAVRGEARDAMGNQVARARGIFAPLADEQMAKFLDKPVDGQP